MGRCMTSEHSTVEANKFSSVPAPNGPGTIAQLDKHRTNGEMVEQRSLRSTQEEPEDVTPQLSFHG